MQSPPPRLTASFGPPQFIAQLYNFSEQASKIQNDSSASHHLPSSYIKFHHSFFSSICPACFTTSLESPVIRLPSPSCLVPSQIRGARSLVADCLEQPTSARTKIHGSAVLFTAAKTYTRLQPCLVALSLFSLPLHLPSPSHSFIL